MRVVVGRAFADQHLAWRKIAKRQVANEDACLLG
jgi:hypothetical protein